MLVWLLVFLLLVVCIYIVYHLSFYHKKTKDIDISDFYKFKLRGKYEQ